MKDPTTNLGAHGLSRRTAVLALSLAAAAAPVLAHAKTRTDRTMDTKAEAEADARMLVGMVVFDGFQLLDVFGPLEMFGALRDKVRIVIVAERSGPVASSAGPSIGVDYTFDTVPDLGVLLVPGGAGTRREVNNAHLVDRLKSLAIKTPNVATVCTGAAVLARTGLLDGLKATTNKRAFAWASGQGEKVHWVKRARWVEDGKYFTSSGISAGMDMALALIAKLFGRQTAVGVANGAEYRWTEDAHDDPFAGLYGLAD